MSGSEEDWMLLNAYADGELKAQEVAALTKRLRREPALAAELARIQDAKAALAGLRPQSRPAPPPAPKLRRPLRAMAAAVTLLVAIGFAGYSLLTVQSATPVQQAATPTRPEQRPADPGTAIALPAVAGGISAPDLSASNLTLTKMSLTGEPAGDRVTMVYRGVNGCRVTLVARPSNAEALAETAALQARWRTARAQYLLSAEGMDRKRFAAIADYAEAQVRAAEQEALRLALIESTAKAAPCA
ncbi:MAG: hypothetical protein RIC87_21535 [Kiloniellales bacterium]